MLYLRDLIFSCELREINQVIEAWLANAMNAAAIAVQSFILVFLRSLRALIGASLVD